MLKEHWKIGSLTVGRTHPTSGLCCQVIFDRYDAPTESNMCDRRQATPDLSGLFRPVRGVPGFSVDGFWSQHSCRRGWAQTWQLPQDSTTTRIKAKFSGSIEYILLRTCQRVLGVLNIAEIKKHNGEASQP
jgi:hypothetical protein